MSCKKAEIAQLNKWFTPAGPCAFCGHRDKRHRIWDTIMLAEAAGETAIGIAWWLELTVIEAVLRIRPYRRLTA